VEGEKDYSLQIAFVTTSFMPMEALCADGMGVGLMFAMRGLRKRLTGKAVPPPLRSRYSHFSAVRQCVDALDACSPWQRAGLLGAGFDGDRKQQRHLRRATRVSEELAIGRRQ
jgi:hypothetical protein